MSVFYDHVMSESKIIGEILKNQKDMLPLSNEQQTEYDGATHCTACGTNFSAKNYKVRQHCHISGNFLFSACNNCNLQLMSRTSCGQLFQPLLSVLSPRVVYTAAAVFSGAPYRVRRRYSLVQPGDVL